MLGIPKDPAGQKKFLLGALPLLLAGGYYWFFHQETRTQIEELTTRYEELQARNDMARARSNPQTVRNLQQKLSMYEQHMKRLEQLIPLREEVPELLYAISARAQETSVDLALMKPDGEEVGEFYTQQSYTMRAVGSYHAIARFLTEIGSLPRIVTPREVNLTVPGTGALNRTAGLRLQADFKIQTYIIPPPDSAVTEATSTQRTNAG